jgi:hypothetical protein
MRKEKREERRKKKMKEKKKRKGRKKCGIFSKFENFREKNKRQFIKLV